MGRNLEKDAVEMAAKNRRILESGFRIFTQNTIEKVKMTDVAEAAGIGIASLYRYYSTKSALVLAVSAWVWEEYLKEHAEKQAEAGKENATAAERFGFFLESFIDLYRNHSDILRFNQFFNVYIWTERIAPEEMEAYEKVIKTLEERFAGLYRTGQRDGTLRTELPEKKMFSAALHLMLAAVTRYAVGLAYYNEYTDPEEELRLQKEMLMQRFCVLPEDGQKSDRRFFVQNQSCFRKKP